MLGVLLNYPNGVLIVTRILGLDNEVIWVQAEGDNNLLVDELLELHGSITHNQKFLVGGDPNRNSEF